MQQINFINFEDAKKQQLELCKKLVLKNSFGHLIDHQTALVIIKASCDNYRIPKPTRLADKYSKDLKQIKH